MSGQWKARCVQVWLRIAKSMSASTAILLSSGCSRDPSLNILGSFFPAWILCGMIGILLTVLVRLVFVRLKFEQELWSLAIVYPCLAASFTFTLWLLFFS
jgi:hypothetical protein